MPELTLRTDETAALVGAGLLHVALIAVLLLQPEDRVPPPLPERVVVNLSEEVGLASTAPDPVAQSRAAQAPTLSDRPAPPVPVPLPQLTQPTPQPTTAPRPSTRTQTQQPRPTRTRTPAPAPTPSSQPAPRRTSTPAPRPTSAPVRTGGSRIGDDFLPGAGTSASSTETRVPASQIGNSAKADIVSAIARQVRPHFQGKVPTGADAEKLVTVLAFELNENGSLKGRPRVVSQSGVTPANEAQKDRHAEVAIRAVQLAAPFDLPDEYYNAWKSIRGARFDRSLSR